MDGHASSPIPSFSTSFLTACWPPYGIIYSYMSAVYRQLNHRGQLLHYPKYRYCSKDNPFENQRVKVHLKQRFVYLPVLEIISQTTQFQSFMKY